MKLNHGLILAAVLGTGVGILPVTGADPAAAPAAPASGTNAVPKPAPKPAKPAKAAEKSAKAADKPAKIADKAVKPVKSAEAEAPARTPLHAGPARVKEATVNVRGQAAISGEVIGHVKRGETVTVLEEIIREKPKQDEPDRWAKITLPSTISVWVFAEYIDATSKRVSASRLKMRGGPGENYSVLGILEKGTPINDQGTKGNWIKIEAPTNAYAFVASHLLSQDPAAPPAIAAAEPKVTTPAPVIDTPVAPPSVPAPAKDPVVTTVQPKPVVPAPEVAVAPPIAEVPAVAAPPAATRAVEGPLPIRPIPEPPLIEEPKRTVTREGVVRRSVSIQAPAYFVLESLDTGRAVNYLFSTNFAMRDYKGRRIIVTGDEILDERWPNTPVITIEQTNDIHIVP